MSTMRLEIQLRKVHEENASLVVAISEYDVRVKNSEKKVNKR